MKLDTLYKRTRTGDIQFWSVETDDYIDDSVIRKYSGKLGTINPVKHEQIVKAGKQKRNIREQAEFEANSDWKRKHDEGYKSLQDLGIEMRPTGMYNPISDPETASTLLFILEKFLPKFNTDASGNVKPMLAKTGKLDKVKFPCYMQKKFDGFRCLMNVESFMDTDSKNFTYSIKFLSRSGKEFTTLDHIKEIVLNAINMETGWVTTKSFILDGELYSDELSFQGISKAIKKQRPESLKIQFRAYDIVNDNNQTQRLEDVSDIVRQIDSELISLVRTHLVYNKEEVKEFHDTWVQEGYEGGILRFYNGTYDQGQRSPNLLKVKEFNDGEFQLLSIKEGARSEDLVAVCQLSPNDDRTFRAKLMGNRAYKAELINEFGLNKAISDKLLTVKYFGWTDDGFPRQPIGKAIRLPEDMD